VRGALPLRRADAEARPAAAAASRRPVLDVRGVTLRYATDGGPVTAVEDVSLALAAGDRLVLLGASGCGKSTLLKAIAGFVAPAAGAILLDGRPVAGPGPDRAVVFQEFDQLLPWRTVIDNVAFPLRVARGLSRAASRARAREFVALVGLERAADAYPHTLSGGMKQRVAIARALALEPAMLLMDEPFAALDALSRRRLQEELLLLWERLRFTMVFVTHAIDEAVLLGSEVVLLSPHPGRVVARLDTAGFGIEAVGSEVFGRTVERIHAILFPPAPEVFR